MYVYHRTMVETTRFHKHFPRLQLDVASTAAVWQPKLEATASIFFYGCGPPVHVRPLGPDGDSNPA
jgi:hypothetical protein